MSEKSFKTKGGLTVGAYEQEIDREEALDTMYGQIDTARGAIFSSGFDYPGRHTRWDIGFVNPAIEFSSKARNFRILALNEQGKALLGPIGDCLKEHDHLTSLNEGVHELTGVIAEPPSHFSEESRSRQPSIFTILRSIRDLFHSDSPLASHFGLYGAFGYDLVTQFEDIELRLERDKDQRDCCLYIPLELIVIDRLKDISARYTYTVETPRGSTAGLSGGGEQFEIPHSNSSGGIVSDHKEGEFAKKVAKIIEGTQKGDYFEVVLSQRFSTPYGGSATDLFRRLAKINPSPYMFLLNFGNSQLVGASPEIFVRVTGKRYETCPIAGTVRRGDSALEDADQVRELLSSSKDESELTMCTDVDRNDMARVCEPGSVQIIGRRQLEFYSHLIHTVDHVEGTLRDEFDSIDAFQSHMWACTVTGAPKPAALQAIEDLENSARRWYSGAIGYLSFNGNINTGITLRTAELRDGIAQLRAGATLLFGSDPKAEEEETQTKAAAFLAAIASASQSDEEDNAPDEKIGVPPITEFSPNILLVDCKDSFVHNLAAYLRQLGARVTTMRSGFPIDLLDEIQPDLVFLSPGPGTPDEFGIPQLVSTLVERGLPIFGVCLGHQGIGQHFGATLLQLPVPEHGKVSNVTHQSDAIFENVENGFEAGRYHSLYLEYSTMPDELEVIATAERKREDGSVELIPMAMRHKHLPIASVQFHPESLMTLKQHAGHHILKNALLNLISRN
jgi:anthranilate synthase